MKITIEFCQEFVKDCGECLSTEYVDCKTRMMWKCNCSYEWPATFDNVYNKKSWCPNCKENRMKKTNLERYGVTNPFKNEQIKLK